MALYDYEAQGADELSVREGEYVVLTALGLDAGDGWAEATKEGRKGLLPVSYLQV
jgi:formin-binding protein 1